MARRIGGQCSTQGCLQPVAHHGPCDTEQVQIEGCGYPPKQRELLERNAAMAAALRRIRWGGKDTVSNAGAGILSREELQEVARAAPQPQSRSEERRYKAQGWLPPEVGKRAAERLRKASMGWHNQLRHRERDYERCPDSDCVADRTALDVLEVK